ncbi:MAG TPA: hypothetical protein VHI13_02720 [Candidatus Kapabacteria bacterium]|nr:hypothetical protein [Candidatus Kapabacteria bacterium]
MRMQGSAGKPAEPPASGGRGPAGHVAEDAGASGAANGADAAGRGEDGVAPAPVRRTLRRTPAGVASAGGAVPGGATDADDGRRRSVGGGTGVPTARVAEGERTERRSIQDVEPEEIIGAIRKVFNRTGPHVREEGMRLVAQELGFARMGSNVRSAIDGAMRAAVRCRVIERVGEEYVLLARDVNDYSRDELVDALRAATGTSWTEREEAIVPAVRHLGFRRTGSAIQEAFRSALRSALCTGAMETSDGLVRKRR